MPEIDFNEEDNILVIDGEDFFDEGDGCVELPANRVRDFKLSDLPRGLKFALCDKVIGTRDLTRRWPHCTFHVVGNGMFNVTLDVAFIPDEDATAEACADFFDRRIRGARAVLARIGPVVADIEAPHVYDDIAYLSVSLQIEDQLVITAHELVGDIEYRMQEGPAANVLFLCHATEDKPFVDRLAASLDQRGLRAWYDKRELYVGDSIVDGINRALGDATLVVAVLSPRSVMKPWVMRELSSSLMRQLVQRKVCVLPVLLEKCELPPLLADIKYADFTSSFDAGFAELLTSIRRFENNSG